MTASVSTVLTIPRNAPEDDHDDDQDGLVVQEQPPDQQIRGHGRERDSKRLHEPEPPLQRLRREHRRQRQQQAPAEEHEPSWRMPSTSGNGV